jgi:hypothetical protein
MEHLIKALVLGLAAGLAVPTLTSKSVDWTSPEARERYWKPATEEEKTEALGRTAFAVIIGVLVALGAWL